MSIFNFPAAICEMAQEKIAQYYLLCGVIEPKNHMVSALNDAEKRLLFSSAEISTYFKVVSGRILVSETVVGGRETSADVTVFE